MMPNSSYFSNWTSTFPLITPSRFLNITPSRHGIYTFGFHDFQVRELQIANIFHRTLTGSSDDFILGIISVLLIAVVSELFQAIVLRSRHGNRITRDAMYIALLLDELTHFRNLTNLFRLSEPNVNTSSDAPSTRYSRIPVWTSITVFIITVMLIAAEVLAVYLTQPLNIYTRPQQYNLRGIMPAGTRFNISRRIMRNSGDRKCVTPSMMHSNQTRMYTINACIERSDSRSLDNFAGNVPPPLFSPPRTTGTGNDDDITGPSATATSFVITSWYHAAGCDHQVKFSNSQSSAWHEIKMRATILQGNIGVRKAIRFHNRDTENSADARYIHLYFIERAIEGFCAQVSNDSCLDSYFAGTQVSYLEGRARNITLWAISDEGSDKDAIVSVVGITTKFDVPPIVFPFAATEYAMPVFATSLAIEEVEGSGLYTNLDTGGYEEEIPDLAYEEGRVASATLLLIIFASLLALLIVMRVFLKPVSLAEVAHNIMHDGPTRVVVVDHNGVQSNDSNNHQVVSNIGPRFVKRRVDVRSADDQNYSVKASVDSESSSSFSRSP